MWICRWILVVSTKCLLLCVKRRPLLEILNCIRVRLSMILIASSPASNGGRISSLMVLRKLNKTSKLRFIAQILILNRRHLIKMRLHVIIICSPHVLLLLLILVSGQTIVTHDFLCLLRVLVSRWGLLRVKVVSETSSVRCIPAGCRHLRLVGSSLDYRLWRWI